MLPASPWGARKDSAPSRPDRAFHRWGRAGRRSHLPEAGRRLGPHLPSSTWQCSQGHCHLGNRKEKKKKEKDSLQPQKYLMQRKQKYLMQYIQTLKVFSERKCLFVSVLSLPSSGRAIRNSETLSSAHRVRITVKVREKHRALLSTHLQVTLIAATVSVCRSRGAERTRTVHGSGERGAGLDGHLCLEDAGRPRAC